MKLFARAAVAAVLLLAPPPALSGETTLDDLAWLAGSWQRETPRGTIVEVWTRLGERVLEGRSYVLGEGGARRPAEDMLLAEMGGEIFYIPKATENPYPVPFRLTSSGERSVVFENPEHDFPRRIVYQRLEDGTLVASIEGPGDDGSPRRVEFRFVRR